MNSIVRPKRSRKVGQQIDDLRLDRDVECGHRLVGDDELRLDRKRAGNADPLALPAGELVRKTPRVLGRETDERQELGDPFPASDSRVESVRGHRFVQRIADAPARVQAGVRVLKDDLKATAIGTHAARRQLRKIGALEPHFAGGRIDQLQHRAADGALARAGFPDEAEHLALRDLEADVVDGADRAVAVAEVFLEAAHRQHRRAGGRLIAQRDTAHSMLQRMQRERWPAGTCASGGIAAEHSGSTSVQRGANAQPGSGSSGLAT